MRFLLDLFLMGFWLLLAGEHLSPREETSFSLAPSIPLSSVHRPPKHLWKPLREELSP